MPSMIRQMMPVSVTLTSPKAPVAAEYGSIITDTSASCITVVLTGEMSFIYLFMITTMA